MDAFCCFYQVLGKVGTVVGSSSLRGRKLAGWLVGWLAGWLVSVYDTRDSFFWARRERECKREKASFFTSMIYRLTYLCISTLYLRSYERAGRSLRSATNLGNTSQSTYRPYTAACLPACGFCLHPGNPTNTWKSSGNAMQMQASMGHGQS